MTEYTFRAQFMSDGRVFFPDIEGYECYGDGFYFQLETAIDFLYDYIEKAVDKGDCIPYPVYKAGIPITVNV